MKFLNLWKRDMYHGVLKRWGYFLLPILIGIIAVKQEMNAYYKSADRGTLLDYWLLFVRGCEPYQHYEFISFELPVVWIVLQAFLLLCVNNYIRNDLTKWGEMVILSSKSRIAWWMSKCIWCILSVILFYGICYLTILCGAARNGVSFSHRLSVLLVETEVEEFLQWENSDVLLVAFMLPLLMSVFITLLQMIISMVWNSAAAFLILLAIQGVSSYQQHLALWGNWGMPMRMLSSETTSALDFRFCGMLSCIGILICVLVGAVIFQRKDLLENKMV